MINQTFFRRASHLLFIALIAFTLLTFQNHGISNDEEVQHVYGRLLLNFYSSGFVDQSAFTYKNLYLYGGMFDLIAAGLEKMFPMWIWDMRHLLSAGFGLLGILAAYKITRQLANEQAAFVAVVLLSITGAWTGAMFTHTKDIPFATCMLWSLYYIIRIAPTLPKPPLSLSVKLGIAVGCALGLRIGAVFSVMYLGLIMLIATYMACNTWKSAYKFLKTSTIHLVPSALVAFVLMGIFWPWGVMSPSHPLEAAKAFSHFAFDMQTVVDGDFVSIGNVPRTYLVDYLAVKLPEIVLLGLLAAIGLAITFRHKIRKLSSQHLGFCALLIAALFPIVFVFATDPALYNGVRHFTFVIPPLVILSAWAINTLIERTVSQPKLQLAIVSVCLVLLSETVYTLYQLEPYDYVYYNHFAGDLATAESKWEGDYWSSSLKEAVALLESKLANQHPNPYRPWLVAVCAENIQGSAYLDKNRFQITKDWVAADFYISTTSMHCDKVLKGTIIGTIRRMGAVLAVIKDRRELTGLDRRPHAAPRN